MRRVIPWWRCLRSTRSLILILAAGFIPGCGSGDESPVAPNTIAPRVISTSPASGANAIATNTTLTVTFSEAVKPATVRILLSGVPRGTMTVTDSIATVKLENRLLQWSDYTATVLEGVEDLAGNRMESNYVWAFATSFEPLGTEWTRRTSPAAATLHDVVRGSYEFLAVGADGFLQTSVDGIAWAAESFQPTADRLYAAFPIGDRFVVSGGEPGALLASLGPHTWIEFALGDSVAHLFDILVTFDGIYMVGTGGAAGTDGVLVKYRSESDWTLTNLGADMVPRSITAFGEGYVIAGEGGLILTSSDGIAWHDASFPPGSDDLYKVRWDLQGNLLLAVGSTVLTSHDGEDWTERTPGASTRLRDVTWTRLNAGGITHTLYCAVGDGGTVLTSTDGLTWTNRSSGVTNDLYGITGGLVPTRFVVVGSDGVIVTSE